MIILYSTTRAAVPRSLSALPFFTNINILKSVFRRESYVLTVSLFSRCDVSRTSGQYSQSDPKPIFTAPTQF
jgi:hypothetical protein